MIKKFENFRKSSWFSELNPPFTNEDLEDIVLEYTERYNLESENFYFSKNLNFTYKMSNKSGEKGDINDIDDTKFHNHNKSDGDTVTIRLKSKSDSFVYEGLDELCVRIGRILGCELPTYNTFRVKSGGFLYKSFADIRIKIKWNI